MSQHITLLLSSITFLFGGLPIVDSYGQNNSFDIFIFTQHWPITTCIDWESKDKKNGCTAIAVPTFTVHGLWPTQFHKIAPVFCNASWHFNREAVKPIMDNLTQYWPDYEIRNEPDSLWSHEWSKHGTCAAILPTLDSELKYFQAGVELAMQNPIGVWLEQRNIMPGGAYSKQEVWDTVLDNARTRPHVDCEHLDGQQYIKEIKLCFNKDLSPTDCDGIVQSSGPLGKMMGTCHEDKQVYFPDRAGGYPSTPALGIVLGTAFGIILLLATVFIVRKVKTQRRGYESI